MKRIILFTLVLCLVCMSAACSCRKNTPAEQPSAPTNPDTPSASKAAFDAGKYVLVRYEVGGMVYEGDTLALIGVDDSSLTLNADHTGAMVLTGSETPINWTDDGDISIGGFPMYKITRVDADTIRMTMSELTFTLRKEGAAPRPDATKAPAVEATEAPAPDETEAPATEAPAPSDQGGEVTIEGKIGWSLKVPVTVTLPSGNWCTSEGSTAYVYNVPDESQAYSDTPRIQFEFKESEEKINFYVDQFENLQAISGRTIGGVDMTGRSYRQYGMNWVEFYGQLSDGCWVAVKISDVDYSAGSEGDAILNSVVFGTPHE